MSSYEQFLYLYYNAGFLHGFSTVL